MPESNEPPPHALPLHLLREYSAVGLVAECCGQHARNVRGKRISAQRVVAVWITWNAWASDGRREQLKTYAHEQLSRWLWDGWRCRVHDDPRSDAVSYEGANRAR